MLGTRVIKSLVRSRLQPGLTASHMMQATLFSRPQIANDYPTFRSTFLETFGDNAVHSLIIDVSIAVDQLHREMGIKDLFEDQMAAGIMATDFVISLEDNSRMPNDVMTKNNIGKFLEFLFYMLFQKSRNRRSDLSNFNPQMNSIILFYN